MKRRIIFFCAFLVLWHISTGNVSGQFPRFRVLAFYSTKVEPDHIDFAEKAIRFFKDLTEGNSFVFDTTSNMEDLNDQKLKDYSVVMWLNDFPHTDGQREAFRKYMENGGGWFGFHIAAYNEKATNWPWLNKFLGCGVFYRNSWPILPAKLTVDDSNHPVTRALPPSFISPLNEWYQWKPGPRENKDVKVLVSLSPENYPLGLKDIVDSGDFPVVWTNTKYRMIYMNMGHNGKVFGDATQDMLFISGLRWIVSADRKGNVFDKK